VKHGNHRSHPVLLLAVRTEVVPSYQASKSVPSLQIVQVERTQTEEGERKMNIPSLEELRELREELEVIANLMDHIKTTWNEDFPTREELEDIGKEAAHAAWKMKEMNGD
jgi:hypothetical protein